MQPLYRCCAGLDIHKDIVVACIRRSDDTGRAREQVRTFGTMTGQMIELADWLADQGVTHVAMEATGSTGSRSGTCWRAASRCRWPTPGTSSRSRDVRPT